MNCLEYRRHYLADPANTDNEMHSHVSNCHSCQQFTFKQKEFENALHDTINIDVPEGLASRILLNQSLEQSNKKPRQRMYAIAASVLLTLSITTGVLFKPTQLSANELVLTHINDELTHLQDKNNIQLAQLNTVLNQAGTQVSAMPYKVNYAGPCMMRNETGAHLVMQGDKAPVTVLVMPGEHIENSVIVSDNRFEGVIVPTSNGSIAIVGEDMNDVNKIRQQVTNTFTFVS